jgi:fructoselysine 6-kinase
MLLALGDNSVDLYPDLGLAFAGGNCVNVAAFAARAGMDAAYLGQVGDDEAGRALLERVREAGVDVSRCRVVRGETAWTRVRIVGRERKFEGYHPGPAVALRLDPADRAYAWRCTALHSSVFSELDDQLPGIKRPGQILSYDLADKPVDRLSPGLLAALDVLFLSRADASPEERAALAATVRAAGVREVVITHGRSGATAYAAGATRTQPAEPIEAIDTLGAGDALIARYLVGMIRGEALAVRVAAAAAAAAAVCLHHGAFGEPLPR